MNKKFDLTQMLAASLPVELVNQIENLFSKYNNTFGEQVFTTNIANLVFVTVNGKNELLKVTFSNEAFIPIMKDTTESLIPLAIKEAQRACDAKYYAGINDLQKEVELLAQQYSTATDPTENLEFLLGKSVKKNDEDLH